MSILIDKLIKGATDNTEQLNDGRWYIAKPLSLKSFSGLRSCFKNGIRVMRGKSFAVHYKKDESI